ncbi:carbohydrate-binding family 9-like protein [Myxococcota bacterium]|nr:carbohydrate-binding family 9-like protein [Myxococcota bacterium]
MSACGWLRGAVFVALLGSCGCARGCGEASQRADLDRLGIPRDGQRVEGGAAIARTATAATVTATAAATATSVTSSAADASSALVVPRPDAPIVVDGKLKDPSWRRAARTGPFVDEHGAIARPYSEARFLVDGDVLYVGLYAADEDIRAAKRETDEPVWRDDAFTLAIVVDARERYVLDVNARGALADGHELAGVGGAATIDRRWSSGMKVAVDADGTLDDPSDDDEEWIVEAALPLASIGVRAGAPRTLVVALARCDTPKDGTRRCGAWGHVPGTTTGARGRLVLE